MGASPIEFPETVLVTGAGGVVGSALCGALVAHGIFVIATDRCEEPYHLGSEAALVTWVQADLEVPEDRDQLVREVRSICNGSLGVVHNASIVGTTELSGWAGPLESQTSETWNRALEVSLTASFSITRDLSDMLRQFPGSAVVHLSSIYSSLAPDWSLYSGTLMGNPAAYGVAKAGVEQLTRWLATSLAPNVRVNAVAPGGLKRDQPRDFIDRYIAKVPLGRMGSEIEVVDAVVFLLSSNSSYITGQTIVVDGGYSIQ